jgi:hypothetical protein
VSVCKYYMFFGIEDPPPSGRVFDRGAPSVLSSGKAQWPEEWGWTWERTTRISVMMIGRRSQAAYNNAWECLQYVSPTCFCVPSFHQHRYPVFLHFISIVILPQNLEWHPVSPFIFHSTCKFGTEPHKKKGLSAMLYLFPLIVHYRLCKVLKQ